MSSPQHRRDPSAGRDAVRGELPPAESHAPADVSVPAAPPGAAAPGQAPVAATSLGRNRLKAQPIGWAATILAIGVLVLGVCPFDFAQTTAQLHADLVRARWFAPPDGLGYDAWAGVTEAGSLMTPVELGTLCAFLAFGALLTLAEREEGQRWRASLELAVVHAAILAVVIEALQFFVQSRAFDRMQAVANTAGALLGGLAVAALVHKRTKSL